VKLHGILSQATLALATFAGPAQAQGFPGQGTWATTLQARDINGDGVTDAFYDTVLKISWLADRNVLGTRITAASANIWARDLNVHGTTGWRLPRMKDLGHTGCDDLSYAGRTDCSYNVLTISN
jgi:hypothetical protein